MIQLPNDTHCLITVYMFRYSKQHTHMSSPTLSHFFRYCIHEKFKIFNKEKLVSIQRRRIYTEDKAKVVDAILRQYEWCKSSYIFFKSSWCKIASATRNWSNSVSQEAATTFAISSAYILLQYCIYRFVGKHSPSQLLHNWKNKNRRRRVVSHGSPWVVSHGSPWHPWEGWGSPPSPATSTSGSWRCSLGCTSAPQSQQSNQT